MPEREEGCGHAPERAPWGTFYLNFFLYSRSSAIHFRKLGIQTEKKKPQQNKHHILIIYGSLLLTCQRLLCLSFFCASTTLHPNEITPRIPVCDLHIFFQAAVSTILIQQFLAHLILGSCSPFSSCPRSVLSSCWVPAGGVQSRTTLSVWLPCPLSFLV